MKEYTSEFIRNVAVAGHGKTGKTSLLEACLYVSGATKRLGKVDDGTGVLDYEAEETKRKMTIGDSLAVTEWKDYKINFIDTPGYPDFVGEVMGAMSAADSALIVVAANAGIEVETEKAWNLAEELHLPRAFFVSKPDREHADFDKVLDELRVKYGSNVVAVQIPIGKEDTFQGVADLIKMYVRVQSHYDESVKVEIPEYIQTRVEEEREKLIEAAAEFNDELMTKYFDGEELDEKEIIEALAEGVKAAKIFPVFVGSATKNIAIQRLLNGIIEYMPAPDAKTYVGTDPNTEDLVERKVGDSFSGQIFKTLVDPFVGRMSYIRVFSGDMKPDSTYKLIGEKGDGQERIGALFTLQGKKQIPVTVAHAGDIVVTSKLSAAKTCDTLYEGTPIQYERINYPEPMLAMSVSSEKKGEEDKVIGSITKQMDEDPTIKLIKDPETKQTILKGIGEVHLDILCDKILRKFGVKTVLGEPKVAYRETIRKQVEVQGKHKKQSGGHGQYGDVWLRIGPNKEQTDKPFNVVWKESIFGGSVPRQYFPAVEKGTYETLAQGIIAGYPVVNVSVDLYDGSYHAVDSSEAAFKTATSIAIKKGVLAANPILLEPINEITVLTPDTYMGDIIGTLNSKRGKVLGMEPKGKGMTEVKAYIPASELYKYATDLRSQTQGRGSYSLKFARYEPMPDKLAEKIIEEHKKAAEEK